MAKQIITIGSRGSQLALWQARHIAAQLAELGVETRLEIIKTTGDKITDVPLAQAGGKGLFTKEIEEALLAGTIDLAVHSLKDMPTALPEGLTLAAIPEREDPRDALIGKPLAELRAGDRIGTSSLRRAAQLRALGQSLEIETLRGNIDTRLRKLDEGQYDTIVLAAAGLRRLGWADRIRELLDPSIMCPAVGQGALAIETRQDGGPAREIASRLEHRESRMAVTAERALLATLEGGCQVPIGAYATVDGLRIFLRAIVASPDGLRIVRDELSGDDPVALGHELGRRLLLAGAKEILRGMKVYLVGAGPGDPDLITIKGRKALERADVILFDHLAPDRLLDLAPAHAERIYVGKKRSQHEFTQEEICAMMIDRARAGKTVVRLKGGDPFIFGRGGEEIEALAAAGIPYEIVPGVTVPLGVAAYTGVPLTHREHTSAVIFVTGHNVEAIDWSKVGASDTIVLFMGMVNIAAIARELIKHGRSPHTPAMAVRWATRPDQVTIAGTLADLASKIEQAALKPPATVVIGEVVALRDRFNWFEKLPLFGQRIIVTRDRRQSSMLAEPLEELGAETLFVPVIEIAGAGEASSLEHAIARLDTYDWLIFTSVNGVRHFVEALDRSPRDLRALKAKICAIGPATRAAIEALHLCVDVMPREYVAESLIEALASEDLKGKRVLLPRAAVARDLVPVALMERGATVDVVEAYRTIIPANAAERAREALARKPHWVTFTSSSTVKNLVEVLGGEAAGREALKGIRLASIGPITTATARDLGLKIDAEANPHTIEGLVEAVVTVCTSKRP